MSRTGRFILWVLVLVMPVRAYWNYDPATPPQGGPHRKINECAWKLFWTLQVREATRPDPILEKYQWGDDKLRKVTGITITTPGDWPANIATGPANLTVAEWIAEGGYTCDEPELFMALRHFYDPTQPEGQRYLTNIPWLAKMREQVRSLWRSDVEFQNPTIDARMLALTSGHPYGWDQGLTSLRRALGPEPLSAAQRDELAAAGWRALGEVMHLMADMTVPAHVRNDGHPGKLPAGTLRPDPYESWIMAPEVQDVFQNLPRTSQLNRVDPLMALDEAATAAVGAGTPSELFHAVASYTNRRFMTGDAINGTDRHGNTVSSVTGRAFPSPLLGRELTFDEEAGAYLAQFNRQGQVMMVKETWQDPTFLGWLRNLGNTMAGGKLTFATSRDCAVDQAKVLLPIAFVACQQFINWYLPRIQIQITNLKVSSTDTELVGTAMILKHGAWAAPVPITLPESARYDLYVNGRLQPVDRYSLAVKDGKIFGSLKGLVLPEESRLWFVTDYAGLSIASNEFSPTGVVTVRVCKEEQDCLANNHNPFEILDGCPIEGATVSCVFQSNGKRVELSARTNRTGRCTFSVPFGVEAIITSPLGEKRAVCTPEKPGVYVTFGYQGHAVTPAGAAD